MSRIPLIATVVGALLVGGAATGVTHASWADQRSLHAHQVAAGSMSFTATSPGAVTVSRTAGSTAETSFVLDDTSAGKNLQQRITATVATSPAGVTATVGTSCASATAASVFVDTTPTSPDQTLCVKVTSSTTAVSDTVTINLSGAQQPTGWSTPLLTRSFQVTVNGGTAPAAPALTCGTSNSNSHTFPWAPVLDATSYSVYRSNTGNTEANYSLAATVATPSYLASLSGNQTSFFRVKAVSSTGLESGYSNTLRIQRSGSNVTCAPVTP